MTQIDFQQAIYCFPALAELAATGEEVVIAKDNQPYIKMVSVKPVKKRRQFGSAKGFVQMADDFIKPLEDFKDYM